MKGKLNLPIPVRSYSYAGLFGENQDGRIAARRGVPIGPAAIKVDAGCYVSALQVVIPAVPAWVHGVDRGCGCAASVSAQQMMECRNEIRVIASARHQHHTVAVGFNLLLAAKAGKVF